MFALCFATRSGGMLQQPPLATCCGVRPCWGGALRGCCSARLAGWHAVAAALTRYAHALLSLLCLACPLCRALGERYAWDLNQWRAAMEARGDKAFTEVGWAGCLGWLVERGGLSCPPTMTRPSPMEWAGLVVGAGCLSVQRSGRSEQACLH